MTRTKAFILALLAVSLLNIIFLYKQDKSPPNPTQNLFTPLEDRKDSLYKFTNPVIANYLLSKLDIFEVIQEDEIPNANYKDSSSGFKVKNNYCAQHRTIFVNNPALIFKEKNFITNYPSTHNLRKMVIPALGGIDLHPNQPSQKSIQAQQQLMIMSLDANIFYNQNSFYMTKQLGKQFSCLSQASNHIPGSQILVKKGFAQSLANYSKQYSHCLASEQRFFLKTWLLNNKEQCLDFFKEINSAEYKAARTNGKAIFTRRLMNNISSGEGIFLVNNHEEEHLRAFYRNGDGCGEIKEKNLIQERVQNPLLIDKRFIEIKAFMLIASTNPVLAYYHDGYVRISLLEYDENEAKEFAWIGSLDKVRKQWEGTKYNRMGQLEIMEYFTWDLKTLKTYLVKKKMIKEEGKYEDWVQEYLKPQMKKAMIHLIRMSQGEFFKRSSVFELFDVDFTLDEDLNVWFIEANANPLINGFTKGTMELMNQMLEDGFEIIFGLIRSRMKRVLGYVNNLQKIAEREDGIVIPELEKRREEFRELSMNRFEDEFVPNFASGFERIIDESAAIGSGSGSGYSKAKVYINYLENECL